jgi:hypothetical protein
VFFLSLVFSARKEEQFSLHLQIPRVKRRPIYEGAQVHGGKAPCILEQSWPLGTPAVLAQGKGPPGFWIAPGTARAWRMRGPVP